MSIAEDARKLREEGKTYPQIAEILGCSKSTVAYHLSPGQKEKTFKRTQERRRLNGALRSVENFQSSVYMEKDIPEEVAIASSLNAAKVSNFIAKVDNDTGVRFSFKDVTDKFGTEPTCYLTGENIDFSKPRTYEFDHVIPKSRGGSNSIDNLGICTRDANRAKQALSIDEFLTLCRNVLEHNGYTVIKDE